MVTNHHMNSFTISFGVVHNKLVPYRGYHRAIRIFRTDETIHELEHPFSAKIVRFNVVKGGNICMQVELFGCEMACGDALGMESGAIKNSEITTSSELPYYTSNQGRLNKKGWCAARKGPFQYIQIRLPSDAKITHIATQGVGDSYVKEYYLQWSRDGNVFLQLDGTITANTNGVDTMKIKLKEPLEAKYIRIIPKTIHISTCMRVEVYGCLMTSLYPPSPDRQVIVTPAPVKDNNMSESAKIGLLAFFLILIAVLVVIAGIYYKRKSGDYSQHSMYSVQLKEDKVNIIDAEDVDDDDEDDLNLDL